VSPQLFTAMHVHLHRNLNQKQHIFAFQIAPVTAVHIPAQSEH